MQKTLRIATRQSPLALWQAHHVGKMVCARVPGMDYQLVEMTTEGDRFLSAPLAQIGGKGLFVKEIEQALIDGRADVAVHSLKDMTSHLPPGLVLGAIPEREDPRDAWVSPGGVRFAEVQKGGKIGTSSQRRGCQIREKRPDVELVNLRGNVQSRLRKTEEQGLAGCVLALAGLRRLELEARITELLPVEVSLPAVGQGALAIECRESDAATRELLAAFEHRDTQLAVTAERGFLAALDGGCTVPMAGFAIVNGDDVWLRALIGAPDGTRIVRGEKRGHVGTAESLGRTLARELLEAGGREILDAFGHDTGRVPES